MGPSAYREIRRTNCVSVGRGHASLERAGYNKTWHNECFLFRGKPLRPTGSSLIRMDRKLHGCDVSRKDVS